MKRRIKLIRNTILGLLLATVPFVTIAQERQGLHEGREMKRERHEGIEERISDLTDKQKESIKDSVSD
jgi:hypothetical protein